VGLWPMKVPTNHSPLQLMRRTAMGNLGPMPRTTQTFKGCLLCSGANQKTSRLSPGFGVSERLNRELMGRAETLGSPYRTVVDMDSCKGNLSQSCVHFSDTQHG
jgi:hypothetical protein